MIKSLLLIPLLVLLILTLICNSCKENKHGPYAIRDFRNDLQPHLMKIVSEGIVKFGDSALESMATDEELRQLAGCEHPVLRACALRQMLRRKSFIHFDVVMNYLDDTGLVATDGGEFGILYRRVSDDVLEEARWKTEEEKKQTIDKVLTKHNYLRAAYLELLKLEPQEKFYPYIRDMATRPRRLNDDGYEIGFDDIEFALYGLAKFKKKNDIPIIKEILLSNVYRLSDVSFRLMREYPDTAYLDVFQEYHRRQFYRFSGNTRGGFTGTNYYDAEPREFINALTVQENERSAKILDTILHWLPKMNCFPYKEVVVNDLVDAIWEHPCSAYANLRDKIKMKALANLKNQMSVDTNRSSVPIDTSSEQIRWW